MSQQPRLEEAQRRQPPTLPLTHRRDACIPHRPQSSRFRMRSASSCPGQTAAEPTPARTETARTARARPKLEALAPHRAAAAATAPAPRSAHRKQAEWRRRGERGGRMVHAHAPVSCVLAHHEAAKPVHNEVSIARQASAPRLPLGWLACVPHKGGHIHSQRPKPLRHVGPVVLLPRRAQIRLQLRGGHGGGGRRETREGGLRFPRRCRLLLRHTWKRSMRTAFNCGTGTLG